MEEETITKESSQVSNPLNNKNNNLSNNQEHLNALKDVTKEANTIKKSPFFFNNSNINERKRSAQSLKLDKKKLKLQTNKKAKKSNKKSSQNIFALSFFKNINEKSIDNSKNNETENNNADDKNINAVEVNSIKRENSISSSQNSQISIEKDNKDDIYIDNEEIKLSNESTSETPENKPYESQKCPICNICLDFYTFSEREKHVNLCIDSSIRKESRKNLGIRKEDSKISSFYKNIKSNNDSNNEKFEETTTTNDNKCIATDIPTDLITDTPLDTKNLDILNLPSNNQFKCKMCNEDAIFSNVTDLYSHIYSCFSKIEKDHFFFKDKLNFILNQNECFCCLKPWPVYEDKAVHLKECISIKKLYLEKIEGLIKHYLKKKEESDKAFLDKYSNNRNYFKRNIYLKKTKPDSMPAQVTSTEINNSSNSIFNLNNIKNESKEEKEEKDSKNDTKEEDLTNLNEDTLEKADEDMEEDFDKKCCFCDSLYEDDDNDWIEQHLEQCIKEKMEEILEANQTTLKYKPKYIQQLTRCPCCSKKWLEYSMADLKEKLNHIYDCSKKNELPLSKISIILNQYKSRFKEDKDSKRSDDNKDNPQESKDINSSSRSNSNSGSNSGTTSSKENLDNPESEDGSDEDLFESKKTNEEIKQSIKERKLYNSQDENNVVILNIEDETTEDFDSNYLSLKLSTKNMVKSYRQRTLYDDIEEDQIKLAKALSKSLYQDENQKIRLKIMSTSTVLSVEDAHAYNFSRANSLLNFTQQEYSLWEMSMLKPEEVLKAETVIEPLQKHSYELRMSLKNEGIDEYIATLTFPIPDRRLLKVNSIEGIDSYFDEQIKNRKARLDKYKKLLTLQSSLWIKKMRQKQHSLKKELLSIDLDHPENIKNTEFLNVFKSQVNDTDTNNDNPEKNESSTSDNNNDNNNINSKNNDKENDNSSNSNSDKTNIISEPDSNSENDPEKNIDVIMDTLDNLDKRDKMDDNIYMDTNKKNIMNEDTNNTTSNEPSDINNIDNDDIMDIE